MLELALHVLDILQNAVEAGATIVELSIVEDVPAGRLTITVSDNGRGMDEQTAGQVVDPFYTTRNTRHVGLGLPLFAASAETTGGGLAIHSRPAEGTTVEARFGLNHLDRQPLGDMAGALTAFLLAQRAPELRYTHRVIMDQASGSPAELSRDLAFQEREFTFDTAAIRAELGSVPLSEPLVARWLRDFIADGEAELRKPELEEPVLSQNRVPKERDNAQAQVPG